MGMMRFSPLMAVVPFALLLTVSFFVCLAARKVEAKALKAFGYVVAGLLCFAALVVFLGTPYGMGKGPMKMKYMMRQKMKMDGMPQMMQKENMPMVKKGPMSKCGGNKGVIFKAE